MTEATTEAAKPDDFDAAFAEVAAEAEKVAAQTPEDAAAATKAAADAAAAAAAETPEAKAAREAAEKTAADAAEKAAALAAETPEAKTAREASEKAAADAAAKATADAAAKAAADAETARLAAEKVAAATAETAEAKAAREAFEASLKPYEPTEDEKKALEAFKKEFPGEHAAIEARLKSVDRDINARVHTAVTAVLKTLDPRLSAVEKSTVEDAATRHFAALHTAHVDYDTLVPKVPEWIKTQPSYLQAAMQAVYEGGTTDEVIALFADFKKATGVVTTPVDTGAAAAAATAAAAETAKKAAAAKKAAEDAAAGIPVTTRRTTAGPKGAPDPLDYDGAFAEVAAAHGAK